MAIQFLTTNTTTTFIDSSTDDIVANWRGDKTWRPAMDAARREHLFSSWNKAVSRSFDWVE